MSHRYSIENIFHFACDECKRWWSVALSDMNRFPDKTAFCPHCGNESIVEKIKMNQLTICTGEWSSSYCLRDGEYADDILGYRCYEGYGERV